MKILEFAMKMEVDGKAYYEQLAKQTLQPGLETIFLNLAADEQKHYEIFQKLINNRQDLAMQESTILATAQNIFVNLQKENSGGFTGEAESLAAYQHAMKLEADSVRLYEQAAAEETDPSRKALLLKIAAEERNHFNILENIFLFISAPDQYPAWAESGSRDDIV